jgi:hypothetical protein
VLTLAKAKRLAMNDNPPIFIPQVSPTREVVQKKWRSVHH